MSFLFCCFSPFPVTTRLFTCGTLPGCISAPSPATRTGSQFGHFLANKTAKADFSPLKRALVRCKRRGDWSAIGKSLLNNIHIRNYILNIYPKYPVGGSFIRHNVNFGDIWVVWYLLAWTWINKSDVAQNCRSHEKNCKNFPENKIWLAKARTPEKLIFWKFKISEKLYSNSRMMSKNT